MFCYVEIFKYVNKYGKPVISDGIYEKVFFLN